MALAWCSLTGRSDAGFGCFGAVCTDAQHGRNDTHCGHACWCASTLLRASSVLHDASRDLAAEPWKAATARYPN